MELPRKSVSDSWDWTPLIQRIDDVSLKKFFYRGQDDNITVVLDTIAGVLMDIALLRRLQ